MLEEERVPVMGLTLESMLAPESELEKALATGLKMGKVSGPVSEEERVVLMESKMELELAPALVWESEQMSVQAWAPVSVQVLGEAMGQGLARARARKLVPSWEEESGLKSARELVAAWD